MNRALIVDDRKQNFVAYWLLLGFFLVIIQVLIGGITRITESGLSITEWHPISGAFFPIDEKSWLSLFDKYKQTDQFRYLKQDINISEFKTIFFWEWLHRNWARFVGIAFILPFTYFIVKKHISKNQIFKFLTLFFLGGLQALMGWVMVKSGLKEGNLFVEHTFLSIHFAIALIILGLCLYYFLEIVIDKGRILINSKFSKFNKCLFVMLFIQLIYGAFMSGMHAATFASTWPSINGEFVPNKLFEKVPLISNFFNNAITIQFIHRSLAYFLFILCIIWFLKFRREKIYGGKITHYLLVVLFCLQLVLGICSLLYSTEKNILQYFAVLHQFIGMLIFSYLVMLMFFVRKYRCFEV